MVRVRPTAWLDRRWESGVYVSRVQLVRIHLQVVCARGVQLVKDRRTVERVRIVRRVRFQHQVVHVQRVQLEPRQWLEADRVQIAQRARARRLVYVKVV